jgi:hypothetical protein
LHFFSSDLQVKVQYKGCHNHCNFQKDFLLNIQMGIKKIFFIEMHYKVKCHVTRLVFKNLQAMATLSCSKGYH